MLSKKNYLGWQNILQESTAFRAFVRFFAVFGVVPYFLLVIWLIYTSQYLAFYFLLFSIALAHFISGPIIQLFIRRKRPYQRYGFKPQDSWLYSWTHTYPDSFPSDHSALAVAASLSFGLWYPNTLIYLLTFATLVGITRVISGYHFLSDIVGGIGVGVISYYVVYYFYSQFVLVLGV